MRTLRLLAIFFLGSAIVPTNARAAEKFELRESAETGRVFRVEIQPKVKGELDTATGDGKAVAHEITVVASLKYLERRLSGTGRDAESLRSLRHYDDADARIEVSRQLTVSRLRNERRLIVAHGRRDGISVYSPTGRMAYEEIDLLRVPGDSLAMLALLPPKSVSVEEEWVTPSWAAQMLAATEAAVKAEITCKLAQVQGGIAYVQFKGRVEGATSGAAAEVDIKGEYQFHISEKYLKRIEVTQTEKRTVGPVAPGMKVTAHVVTVREPSKELGPLTDAAVAAVPLEPEPGLVMLEYRSPWNVQFEHDRNWHVFHQAEQVAVLRLLDKGSLIAQCNLSPVPPAAAGQHTPEEQFQNDIRMSLGDRLKSIEKAELLKSEDDCFRYRVTVVGEANKVPMYWIYYLCADPSGKQVAFVFAVESKLLGQLTNRDLGIVKSLTFLAEPREPAKAAAR